VTWPVCAQRSRAFFRDIAVQHPHQVGAEVLPAAVAEGAGDELPPLRRGVVQIEQLDPALGQQVVKGEDSQVDHDQDKQRGAGLVCVAQPRLLCAACMRSQCAQHVRRARTEQVKS